MTEQRPARGFRRHLEGWPVGLAIVSAALLSSVLVVPRRVEPELIPPPVIDRIEQAELDAREQSRSARARAGLPKDVRAVGEAFRRFGRASFDSPEPPLLVQRQLQRLAQVVIVDYGDDALLDLRALQTDLFVQALLEGSDAEPALEQRELGGRLLVTGRQRGWFAPSSTAAGRDELASLFHVHWMEALGLLRHPYAPTLNEWRVYYRFLLSRPSLEGPEREGDLQRKLGYVAALAQHDQGYPSHLARGVLLYQRGSAAAAAAEFEAHLRDCPDGAWTLRAKNYLAACGALLSE